MTRGLLALMAASSSAVSVVLHSSSIVIARTGCTRKAPKLGQATRSLHKESFRRAKLWNCDERSSQAFDTIASFPAFGGDAPELAHFCASCHSLHHWPARKVELFKIDLHRLVASADDVRKEAFVPQCGGRLLCLDEPPARLNRGEGRSLPPRLGRREAPVSTVEKYEAFPPASAVEKRANSSNSSGRS
eukprot:CAMPEP_0113560128 /NCGR_PEP_ID=MMETSP0015_2-20120614/19263_1 /TAXON_ID=2838 /ORGANISM="Odontella" /LENGTH=188 /DNA_ID=CAMNT_0000461807 /DNA_START=284 /DNA_END=851 /DNA_ORIENTATION=- /assembly_acc=CAM_ASM_000160